jgi:4-amino-4-deoxy-L-arabinose transferase-like glycosyltransferase
MTQIAAHLQPATRPIPPAGQAMRPGIEDTAELERRFDACAGLSPALWILIISAFTARVAAVLISGDWTSSAAGEYGSLAASLVQGDGFALNETASFTQHGVYEPSSFRPPTYVLLLAGLYALLGVKAVGAHVVALALNALLGAATVPMVHAVARRAGGREAVPLLAATLLAFWPTQLMAVTFVQPVVLIAALLLGSVLLWFYAVDSGRLGAWLAFSFVTALLALTEPMFLPVLAGASALVLVQRKLPWPIRFRNAAVLAAVVLLVIGPWTYRNWRVHGAFVPVTSTFWMNVWMGNNPGSTGTDRLALTVDQLERFRALGDDRLRQDDLLSDGQRQALDGRRAIEREAIWKGYALDFIRQNPARYVELCQIRLARTVWADWDNPRSRDPLLLYFTSRSLLLVGTLVGLLMAVWAGWRAGWIGLLLATAVVFCTLTITAARVTLPLEGLQIPFVALAGLGLWNALLARHQRPPIVRRFMGQLNDGAAADSLGLSREPGSPLS